jgi:vacuolar-type H+-ATPase subunit H
MTCSKVRPLSSTDPFRLHNSWFASSSTAVTEVKALQSEGKGLLESANTALAEGSEATQASVRERQQESDDLDVETCEKERDEIQSNLNCMANVSSSVLDAYKKRKKEVRLSLSFPFLSIVC